MSRRPRALVGNAADATQVRAARVTERLTAERAHADLAAVLSTPEGRRVLWRLLSECHVFSSCWDGHGSRMAYLIGQQDVGHQWLAELTRDHAAAYLLMQSEAMAGAGDRPEEPDIALTEGDTDA